ncbi:hypothetical protein BDZ91DRAFT_110029 [Kalaharituber pfeilii]|nr:hypothetical protein BDZ91DRAFT_110029 [Kalaharituber pfeilii]
MNKTTIILIIIFEYIYTLPPFLVHILSLPFCFSLLSLYIYFHFHFHFHFHFPSMLF